MPAAAIKLWSSPVPALLGFATLTLEAAAAAEAEAAMSVAAVVSERADLLRPSARVVSAAQGW